MFAFPEFISEKDSSYKFAPIADAIAFGAILNIIIFLDSQSYLFSMRKIWVLMLLASIGTLLFVNPSAAVTAMIKGSHDAVNLAMSLVALYAFWLGLLSILEKTGIADKLAKLLRPVVKFLFPNSEEESQKFITMNMSANILGLGNAATPMAIRAINSMENEKDDGKASINMIMLVVISSTSLQLLPSTVIGMRATHGSANPADFLFPCIIATVISTVIGITLVKVWWAFMKKRVKKTAKNTKNEKHSLPKNAALPLSKS